jgi:hypothetical protein
LDARAKRWLEDATEQECLDQIFKLRLRNLGGRERKPPPAGGWITLSEFQEEYNTELADKGMRFNELSFRRRLVGQGRMPYPAYGPKDEPEPYTPHAPKVAQAQPILPEGAVPIGGGQYIIGKEVFDADGEYLGNTEP